MEKNQWITWKEYILPPSHKNMCTFHFCQSHKNTCIPFSKSYINLIMQVSLLTNTTLTTIILFSLTLPYHYHLISYFTIPLSSSFLLYQFCFNSRTTSIVHIFIWQREYYISKWKGKRVIRVCTLLVNVLSRRHKPWNARRDDWGLPEIFGNSPFSRTQVSRLTWHIS